MQTSHEVFKDHHIIILYDVIMNITHDVVHTSYRLRYYRHIIILYDVWQISYMTHVKRHT